MQFRIGLVTRKTGSASFLNLGGNILIMGTHGTPCRAAAVCDSSSQRFFAAFLLPDKFPTIDSFCRRGRRNRRVVLNFWVASCHQGARDKLSWSPEACQTCVHVDDSLYEVVVVRLTSRKRRRLA